MISVSAVANADANCINEQSSAEIRGGDVDISFHPGASINGTVYAVLPTLDGKVLIGGAFTDVGGVSRGGIARLHHDGSLDTTFANGMSGVSGGSGVATIALQPDGKILIGGFFSVVHGVLRAGLARLNGDGSLDAGFVPAITGGVRSLALDPSGKVLVAGSFVTNAFGNAPGIVRLKSDGSLDFGFVTLGTGTDGREVRSVVLQPDGRVLIGGSFSAVNNAGHGGIALLTEYGGLDNSFADPWAFNIRSVAYEPGRVLGGGSSASLIRRFSTDGSPDESFQGSATAAQGGAVDAVVVHPDGRILIAGTFTAVDGVSRSAVARLLPDGGLDTTFLDGMEGATGPLATEVHAVALEPDGRVLIAGEFTEVNGVGSAHLARLYGSPPLAPTIVSGPSSQSSYFGCCAVFHVQASGTPLDYCWRKNGVDLVDGGSVSGAATATLTLTGVQAGDSAAYSVVVSNVLASVTSDEVGLSVAEVPQCRTTMCDAVLGCSLSPWAGVMARDLDHDGYGDAAEAESHCSGSLPLGYVGNAADCDDAHFTIRPGAPEPCNGVDDDCDGSIDDGAAASCNDRNPCTDDVCSGSAGCARIPNTLFCTDGNPCTIGDICSQGACGGPGLASCDDGNACTDDSCAPPGGCVYTWNGCPHDPRDVGFWRAVCDGAVPDVTVDPSDLQCFQWMCSFSPGLGSMEEVCARLSFAAPDDPCEQAKAQMIAMAFNYCRNFVGDYPVQLSCSTAPSLGTAFAAADDSVCHQASCIEAHCILSEILSGKALGLDSLRVNRDPGGTRLTWAAPYSPDLGAPVAYQVWRRSTPAAAFQLVLETPNLSWLDSFESLRVEYEVRPVW